MATTWRPLGEADLRELQVLAARVLAIDGGLPTTATESFLRGRLLQPESLTGFAGATLVAAAAVRPVADRKVGTGLVDPDHRGRGLGLHLLDWTVAAGADRYDTESVTAAGDALFRSRGLRQTFAEDVMAYDLTAGSPAPQLAPGIELTAWTGELAPRFFAVYVAAFRDRPGFPGWSRPEWVNHLTGDDEFAPEWTVLASRAGNDIGFVACDRGAWLVQVGVVPVARNVGLGTALTAGALRQMYEAGERQCYLNVNTNNPTAAGVYRRLGFSAIGRRARYERG